MQLSHQFRGGADSDIILDMLTKLDPEKQIRYIWFDTGVEYKATKEHLEYLENKYGITIERQKPVKTVAKACKEYGQPFLSKMVSENMYYLQMHNFQWEDEPYEILTQRYQHCLAPLEWWCCYVPPGVGKGAEKFHITHNKYLKEFIMQNPPWFKISNKCCKYAKKNTAKRWYKENGCDLNITGVRKSEGGIRSAVLKNCYTQREDKYDDYRPIFWYANADKKEYEEIFDVCHSRCYTEYGLVRTGCVGCPFAPAKDFTVRLEAIKQYEPNLYKACNTIFKDTYEYTRMYREFVKEKDAEKAKSKE